MINPHIFKAYDIRGKVPEELNEEAAFLIGKATGTFFRRKGLTDVVTSIDARVSSKALYASFLRGFLSTGCNAYYIGCVPSPITYFAQLHFKKQGCSLVTASHNPGGDNGFKGRRGTLPIFANEIQDIHNLILKEDFETGKGKEFELSGAVDAYVAYLKKNIGSLTGLTVALDPGNGMFGEISSRVFKELGCKVKAIYTEIDCTFPNHIADPVYVENLTDLIKIVKKDNCSVGFAFDGDGDRIGVIDENGSYIPADRLLAIFAREILSRKKGAGIIYEVNASDAVVIDIEKHGGKAIISKTGHTHIEEKMEETGALLAGELSGHQFFKDGYLGYDDGLYSALRFAKLMLESKKTPSELNSGFEPRVTFPEARFECSDDKKFKVVAEIVQEFKDRKLKVNDLDGARVTFANGWGLIRASNTGPKISIRFEAKTSKELEEIKNIFRDALKKRGFVKLPF